MSFAAPKRVLFTASLAFSLMTMANLDARAAGKSCVVTDPARSGLNLRATPQGGNAGRLNDGQRVEMTDISYDNQNRAWARISGRDSAGRQVSGWVFREFLNCQ